MKRESIEAMLKTAGVAEDKLKGVVDGVMAENGKDIEAEKGKTIAKEKELEVAGETITGLKDTLKKYDGKDPEKLQGELDTLSKKYDDDVKAAKGEAENLKKEFSLKESLRDMGISDPDYLIYKHGGVDKFSFDKEGKPVGVEETILPYKESLVHLFAKPETKYKPNAGSGGNVANPWAKDTFNLTKQGEILKENPGQAKELMSAAGAE